MLGKRIVLAVVFGLSLACVASTSASANWGHKEAPLQQTAKIGLTGTVKLTSEQGGVVECQVTYGVALEPGTSGKVESLSIDGGTVTEKCKTGGDLAKCQVHQFEPTGLQWPIHMVDSSKFTITTGEIHVSVTGSECPIAKFTTTPGSVNATTSTPHVLGGNISLSGTVQQDVFAGGKAPMSVGGTLTVESPNSGTYELLLGEPLSWTHLEEPITEDVEIGLTGKVKIGIVAYLECEVTLGIKLVAGTSTGFVQSMQPDGTPTEKCKSRNAFTSCSVHGFKATGLPWTIHARITPSFWINFGKIEITTGVSFQCGGTVSFGPVRFIATPDNPNLVNSFQLSSGIFPMGLLSVESPNAGTYGFG
jgi:hypothetical protein